MDADTGPMQLLMPGASVWAAAEAPVCVQQFIEYKNLLLILVTHKTLKESKTSQRINYGTVNL